MDVPVRVQQIASANDFGNMVPNGNFRLLVLYGWRTSERNEFKFPDGNIWQVGT